MMVKRLSKDLIPQELKDAVVSFKRKLFSISFYLDKDIKDEDLIE